jgi:hypothetical protein
MNKTTKILLVITSILAVGGVGYYLYEKKRIAEINARVDTLEDALKKIDELGGN